MSSALIVVSLLVLVAICFLLLSVRRVPRGTAGVMERLGGFHRTLGPGVHLVLPGDRIRTVDLSEKHAYLSQVPLVTADATVLAEGDVCYAVVDARAATYEVADHREAVRQLAVTTLRAIAVERATEDLLTSSGAVAELLRGVLAETVPQWGLGLRGVEVTLLRDQPR